MNTDEGSPSCQGLGFIDTDLAFMDRQETLCPTSGDTTFTAEALAHIVHGLTIADVEGLTVAEALDRLDGSTIQRRLIHLGRVGLRLPD